jgi:hypothetical protein
VLVVEDKVHLLHNQAHSLLLKVEELLVVVEVAALVAHQHRLVLVVVVSLY